MDKYNHEIKIDEISRQLTIYRVFENGRKELYTSVLLPDITPVSDRESFEKFTQILGENILIDSPIARKLFSL